MVRHEPAMPHASQSAAVFLVLRPTNYGGEARMRIQKLVVPAFLFGTAALIVLPAMYGCNGEFHMGDTTPANPSGSASVAAAPTTPAPTAPPNVAAHMAGGHLPAMHGSQVDVTGDIEFNENADTFKTDGSGAMDSASAAVLQQVAQVMSDHPDITKLRIEGYTDNVGAAAYNLDLSQRRANTVMGWLTKQGNVDSARLAAKGFGPANPLADNSTPGGQSKNRRTEFHVQEMNNQPYAPDATGGASQ